MKGPGRSKWELVRVETAFLIGLSIYKGSDGALQAAARPPLTTTPVHLGRFQGVASIPSSGKRLVGSCKCKWSSRRGRFFLPSYARHVVGPLGVSEISCFSSYNSSKTVACINQVDSAAPHKV